MKNFWIAGLLLVAFIAWELGSPYVFSKQLKVSVVAQTVSRSCSEGRLRIFGRTRSTPPQSHVFGYCGWNLDGTRSDGCVASPGKATQINPTFLINSKIPVPSLFLSGLNFAAFAHGRFYELFS